MSVPGVGTIVALTYAAAIDDPTRFTSSKTVGAHFGLTPTRYQSGETDRIGRISKIGDASVRATLYESAHIIITRPVKGCMALKSWAMRIAKRAGMKKAKVALARKIVGVSAIGSVVAYSAIAARFVLARRRRASRYPSCRQGVAILVAPDSRNVARLVLSGS